MPIRYFARELGVRGQFALSLVQTLM
ncbi:hypothetical protein CUJ84_Chr001173 [Rhizobium leguminosarum]|uniref:Uncharacterized protein n=1 Tax=Rhizobium leguminosarum TaxID=384 RepID=A0A2K9Z0C6_RHILE|nr:hypothetical protein CUJ84_Chr001173 [Rhizobium leguminosarum]